MELEIGSFKIKKDGKEMILTEVEAKELYKLLNKHFGLVFDFDNKSFATNGTFEVSTSKTSRS